MKSIRLLLPVVVLALVALGTAQTQVAPSDAQKSFDNLKTLAGNWEGRVKVNPPAPDIDGKMAQLSLSVTSMGNAMTHEIHVDSRPDHPLTVFYIDSDRLMLTHYCDAGNRPRMVAKSSPDGKTIEFDFLDVAGDTHYGHMHHAVITLGDANHHSEDWTFMVGDTPVHAHFDLQRVPTTVAAK